MRATTFPCHILTLIKKIDRLDYLFGLWRLSGLNLQIFTPYYIQAPEARVQFYRMYTTSQRNFND